MMIVAGDPPDFRTISDFKALAALFCAGVEARGKGGPCEARARGARRHKDQNERLETLRR
jgi:hypothetical protein